MNSPAKKNITPSGAFQKCLACAANHAIPAANKSTVPTKEAALNNLSVFILLIFKMGYRNRCRLTCSKGATAGLPQGLPVSGRGRQVFPLSF